LTGQVSVRATTDFTDAVILRSRLEDQSEEGEMDIDSEAQKDLALDDAEAESIAGGIETTKKSSKHYSKGKAKPQAAHNAGPRMIVQAAVYGAPYVSANSGDDDCAPESGGDPGATT
jgi:hypothetical protein